MRSLSKEPEIMNSATYIESYLRQRFSNKEKTLLTELKKLEKDNSLFKTIKKYGDKK